METTVVSARIILVLISMFEIRESMCPLQKFWLRVPIICSGFPGQPLLGSSCNAASQEEPCVMIQTAAA